MAEQLTSACPECGCEEYVNENWLGDGFRQCKQCDQEWWTDIKYNHSKTHNMQPNKIDLTKILKVGDKVWSTQRGEGIVEGIYLDAIFPIKIKFSEEQEQCYSIYGFYDRGCITHELYPSSALEPWPEPCPFEKGELVWGLVEKNWYPFYFRENINGKMRGEFPIGNVPFFLDDVCKFTDCPLPPKIDVK